MKLTEIKPNPNNPRIIKDDKFKKLKKSIQEFPEMLELRPIIVNKDGMILGGNMRYKACLDLKMDEVPVKVAEGLTEAQEKEFVIKDNLSFGENDWNVLLNQWDTDQLEDWGMDLPDDFTKEEVVEDDFDTTPPVEPKTRTGELWTLGEHRLLVGDSMKREDVEKLMGGERADLFITDPPYGVSYTAKNIAVHGNVSPVSQGDNEIENDEMSLDDIKPIWFASAKNAYDFCSNECSYYWFACQGGDQMMMMMMIGEAGWLVRHELIWKKSSMVFGRSDYHYQHEPIIYGWKKKGKHNWYSDRTQTSILEFDRPSKSELHPTTKPVELIAYLVGNSSKVNDGVLDLFGGSGTSLIACEQLQRKCYMMEISERYCDVILKRWAEFTGKDPIRDDGMAWSELCKS